MQQLGKGLPGVSRERQQDSAFDGGTVLVEAAARAGVCTAKLIFHIFISD
jgi:hypothetical protein